MIEYPTYTKSVDYNMPYTKAAALGLIEGVSVVNKFFENDDIDTGAAQLLATWGGTFDPATDIISTAQTCTITYNNGTDGLGTTGALILLISYLDVDYNLAEAVHVLSNTGSEVTAFTTFGINRCVVISNGGASTNTNNITLTATTDSTIQAQIPALSSVTQQCLFHTPISSKLLLEWLYINCLRFQSGGTQKIPQVTITGYSWSRVTETRYQIFKTKIDTQVENTNSIVTPIDFPTGGREVIYFVAETTENNTFYDGRYSGILVLD